LKNDFQCTAPPQSTFREELAARGRVHHYENPHTKSLLKLLDLPYVLDLSQSKSQSQSQHQRQHQHQHWAPSGQMYFTQPGPPLPHQQQHRQQPPQPPAAALQDSDVNPEEINIDDDDDGEEQVLWTPEPQQDCGNPEEIEI